MAKAAASDPTDIPPEVPDERVDALYGLPLDEFTAARDALAKDLRKEGECPGAEWVKALRKPSGSHRAGAESGEVAARSTAEDDKAAERAVASRAKERAKLEKQLQAAWEEERSGGRAVETAARQAEQARREAERAKAHLEETEAELERARAAHLEASSRVEELGRAVESDGDGG